MKKNVLITGAAKRIGASCAQLLHDEGYNVLVHYHASQQAAEQLCAGLNQKRPDSAQPIQANLLDRQAVATMVQVAQTRWGGIDVLINNASSFYATPLANISEEQWDDVLGTNLKAPFFLSQALAECLSHRQGCIINIVDIHAERGLPGYAVYSIAKAGLVAMTKVFAKELAPLVRVNAIAPGAILWPEKGLSVQEQDDILQRIPLARRGAAEDIAKAVRYLVQEADYVTGQVFTVDGGRTLFY